MGIQTRREPFAESWRATALRTGTIAVAIGVGVGVHQRRLAAVPVATLVALWFSLGGHFVEVLFRNQLRHRIGGPAPALVIARLVFWFAAGAALYAGALATRAMLLGPHAVPWPWWTVGLAFVGLELLIHLLLHWRGKPNFYDGRG